MWQSVLTDWVELTVRWTHVVTGIAWIGASFYFIALDASLQPNPRLDPRVTGEAWQVHGGGFYHIQKFTAAPEYLPQKLTWFMWEAYSTWIFGFVLLVLIYYLHPEIYLIDRSVADLSPAAAVAIAAGSLVVGWFGYDALCRSRIGQDGRTLAIAGLVLLLGVCYGYARIFSGRGAFIQVGALVGTVMVANVLFVIIPNQRLIVADLIAGRVPDPALGAAGKHRSVHNNYLTLPVVFTMISNHYAFTYATQWSWLILAAVFVTSFLVRHWFNLHHAGAHPGWWLWPAAAVPILALVGFTVVQQAQSMAGAGHVTFADVRGIIDARCHACHAAHPQYPGIDEAPKGVMFDTPEQIKVNAERIYAQAVTTEAMPLNNLTEITPEERAALGAWYAAGARAE
jgi:uncharacterized membrane protein